MTLNIQLWSYNYDPEPALSALSRPDVLVSASPLFPTLFPAMLNARVRCMPWVIWLHDILPDGAASGGIVDDGSVVIRAACRLEGASLALEKGISWTAIGARFAELSSQLVSTWTPS